MFVQCICNVVSVCVSVVIHVVCDVCALVNLYVIVCLYGYMRMFLRCVVCDVHVCVVYL